MNSSESIIYKSSIGRIYEIRGVKVMLDNDLANLYGVETKALNQAVNRNKERFPSDFMFSLTQQEFSNLKSQIVTSSWGGKRKLPAVFTEHSILMLSSVLRSEQAVEEKYDSQFKLIFQAIKNMLDYEVDNEDKKIGFKVD